MTSTNGLLAGRRAFVTGASGGLGGAIVRRFVAEGAAVVATGRRVEALEALAEETGAEVLACDLADRAQLDRVLGIAQGVDLLVSNAALPATGTLDDFTVEEIDRALDVNVRAPVLLARAAGTAMAARGRGHIVLISSMAAKTAGPAVGLYAATKAGLRGLGLSIREDLRPAGVGVSIIIPGPISGVGMWADAGLSTPTAIRPKTPEAVARAVVDAITHNRAEVEVASIGLRTAAVLAQLRPAWFAALGRSSAGKYAVGMTAAGRKKR
ncbi:MAG: SDR family NAD(P)-dependent oxidoreductase [Actinomycetota bacterium]